MCYVEWIQRRHHHSTYGVDSSTPRTYSYQRRRRGYVRANAQQVCGLCVPSIVGGPTTNEMNKDR